MYKEHLIQLETTLEKTHIQQRQTYTQIIIKYQPNCNNAFMRN